MIIALVMVMMMAAAKPAPLAVEVSLSGKTLDVRLEDELLSSYPISPGVDKHPTPKGTFRVKRIVWNPNWVPPKERWARGKKPTGPGDPKNPMKVVKIFFKEPDYYIHGTAEEHLLGEPASHGCIRMSPGDAYKLARMIMEHSGAAKPDEWYEKVLEGKRTTSVRVPRPVLIRIGI